MYILSGIQIKEIDNRAINELGIHSLVLMERAALESVKIIEEKFNPSNRCVIVCGKGNNGGDGFAIARLLFLKGYVVKIISVTSPAFFSDDCRTNYEITQKLGIKILNELKDFEDAIQESDFVVDALFGFGFKGILSGFELEIVKLINKFSNYTYSIDIPSGVSADSAQVIPEAVIANETITFTTYKKSAFLFPAAEYYGKISVVNIGIPSDFVKSDISAIDNITIEKRHQNLNKASAGKVLVIAGSEGLSGAAYLASIAALRSGAGLVTLAVPKCISQAMEQKTTEVMTISMDDDNGSFAFSAKDKLTEIINNYDAVVFGPGVGRTMQIKDILISLLSVCKIPFIIDADGLFALKDCLHVLNDAMCEIIITPHSMEMARLLNEDVDYIENNRYDVCQKFSEEYAVCTVLKGAYTIICDKSGEICVNTNTANPGMATAGSGDVLSGIIAAFAAKNSLIFDAGCKGVYIHGIAGDFAKEEFGEEALIAGDIVNNIGKAIKSVSD